jgi:hypothetical protein
MPPIQLFLRHARRLQEAWEKHVYQSSMQDVIWSNARRAWERLAEIDRQIELASRHNLREALRSVQEDFRGKLAELIRDLQALQDLSTPPTHEPTQADWVCELQALNEEFGTFTLDARLQVVRVTTEPVSLKDVDLGRFAIELHLSRLANQRGSSCFEIAALEPNPASGREEVTHPHVTGGELCAGDAAKPIAKALVQGRLCEAFLLIRSVLTTYNPKSAYVSLEEWDGIACGDCGGRVHRDHSSYCEGCHSDLCDGCTSSCRSCDETRCAGCLTSCDGCSDLCCARCLETLANRDELCSSCRGICSGCDAVLRLSELDDDGQCLVCAEHDESDPSPIPEESHAS